MPHLVGPRAALSSGCLTKRGKAELAGLSGGDDHQCTCAKGRSKMTEFPYVSCKKEGNKACVVDGFLLMKKCIGFLSSFYSSFKLSR